MAMQLTTFQNKLINEILVPIGLLVALIVGCYIASQ
jgi:hypothetical protein